MNPRHHPSSEILAAYAAGALEPGFGLVTGAHVAECAACRSRVGVFEAASGVALEALPEADVASASLSLVMSRLEEVPARAPEAAIDARTILERLPLKRRRWVAPGVWMAPVDTPHDPGNRVYVLSIAPGMPTARHSHSGAEFCTVLKGAYRDELGLFQAGDFAAVEGDFQHQPVVEGDEACVCLFATEGRLQANGLIGSLAFRIAGV
jgi:putative transcriptional regulator